MKTLDDALKTPGVIDPDAYSIGTNDCFFEAKDGLIMISGYDLTPQILRRIADHLDPQPVSEEVA